MFKFDLFDTLRNHSAGVVLVVIALILARNSYSAQSQMIKTISGKIEAEKKINEELLHIEKAKKLTESAKQLINRKNLSMVINHISDFAKESSVNVISIRPQVEKTQEDYVVYPYDMMLSANSYHAIGEFISRIENSQDIFLVEELAIKPDTQDSGSGKEARLLATIKVNTYWMIE